MDTSNECFMKAIFENDLKYIILNKDIHINKICSNGMTLVGAAAQTGNLALLKLLLEYHNHRTSMDPRPKPQYLQLECNNQNMYKNIGYFVVCRDLEENDFGDGPTPEGMEGLEWDMEVNDSSFPQEDDPVDDTINMYKWYASILNRTSVLLESPDKDFGRLDRHGQSVLHYAVNSGNIDMVEYLMDNLGKDLNINQNDACYFNPLHMAAANGDSEMVRCLLCRGASVNVYGGRQRQTALHVAVRGGHMAVINLLLESGSDINALDVEEKSVLTLSVRQGCEEVVKILVTNGARVNHEEPGGLTPLRLAVWSNNAAVVKILLNAGARIIHSHHLLHNAISNNNFKVVKLLIEAGTALNVRDEHGYTPLMLACSRKNLSIIRLLLSKGADINAMSHIDGRTALHVCVQDVRVPANIYDLLELLINHGANMNAPSYQGSVLFYSIILENLHATVSLIQHGADVNLRDERAFVDILSLAKRYGNLQLVRMIVYAGFRLSGMSLDPKTLRKDSNDPSCDFLVSVKTNPLNLRELCRIVVRRKMGPKRLISRIRALPLPPLLHRYLSLEIL
ncbi:putative ankyrin repeat protein RF_0381 isoform X2 [Cylas formicarius]|uniref:putative ankyrin repeat protein RF_0381 isoform X2 n=1 Tax=Cylas formicarius TaxID=197179 RepID=UPI002958AD37|nr:putative ankyrin repeat protein RF_0381 isoform X2 [Cylas formicarius]